MHAALRSRSENTSPRPAARLLAAPEGGPVPRGGPVASVQVAELAVAPGCADRLWERERLERLGRAYWRWVTRVTVGLVRVVEVETAPTAILLTRRLPLLRFRPPEYEHGPERGLLTWRIEGGLLVARAGRGRGIFRLTVARPPDGETHTAGERLEVRLELRGYYPSLRGAGRFAAIGAWLYAQTQMRFHLLVCNSFLRALPRLV
jgi:hypothetical protein